MKRLRSPLLVLLLATALLTSACTDADRKKLAQASDDMARGLQTALALDSELIKNNLISKDDAVAITSALLDVNRLGQQLNSNARTYGTSGGSTKADLIALAGGINTSLATLNQQGALHIKNEQSKTQFLAAVAVMSAALAVLNGVIGGLK